MSLVTILVILSVSSVVIGISILYTLYEYKAKTIDKSDFLEYAKITKQKYDEQTEEIKDIQRYIRQIRADVTAIFETVALEYEDRKKVFERIEKITTQLESISKTIGELTEDRAKLKASLVYSKKRIKELKKELKELKNVSDGEA